jgi:hypothetical protein
MSRVSSSFQVIFAMGADSDCASEDYDYDPFYQQPFNKPQEEVMPATPQIAAAATGSAFDEDLNKTLLDDNTLEGDAADADANADGEENADAGVVVAGGVMVEFRPRQEIVKYFTDVLESSFCDYLIRKQKLAETCKLRTSIDKFVRDQQRSLVESGLQVMPHQFYECYFNYDLTTATWRHIVNK